MFRWIGCTLLLFALLPGIARAAEPPAVPSEEPERDGQAIKDGEEKRLQVYDEIQVTDRASDMVGVADSASEGVTGQPAAGAAPHPAAR